MDNVERSVFEWNKWLEDKKSHSIEDTLKLLRCLSLAVLSAGVALALICKIFRVIILCAMIGELLVLITIYVMQYKQLHMSESVMFNKMREKILPELYDGMTFSFTVLPFVQLLQRNKRLPSGNIEYRGTLVSEEDDVQLCELCITEYDKVKFYGVVGKVRGKEENLEIVEAYVKRMNRQNRYGYKLCNYIDGSFYFILENKAFDCVLLDLANLRVNTRHEHFTYRSIDVSDIYRVSEELRIITSEVVRLSDG